MKQSLLDLPLPSPAAKVKEKGRTGRQRSMLDVFNDHQQRSAIAAALILRDPATYEGLCLTWAQAFAERYPELMAEVKL